MGLNAALTKLHGDRAVDAVVRDVLVFFRTHGHECFPAGEVARRTARPYASVEPILHTLAACFVLNCHSDPPCYRYDPDPLLELDVERFLHRMGTVDRHLQNNVARFRERQSGF